MLTKQKALSELVETFPGFQTALDEFLHDEDIAKHSMCALMFPFCNLVMENYIENYKFQELDEVARVIERFITDGDEDVIYAAKLCFLESVVNACMHHGDEITKRFTKHLGPKAKEFCRESDKLWGSNTPGL